MIALFDNETRVYEGEFGMSRVEITEEMVEWALWGANRLMFGESEISRTRIRNALDAALSERRKADRRSDRPCEHDWMLVAAFGGGGKPGGRIERCTKCRENRTRTDEPEIPVSEGMLAAAKAALDTYNWGTPNNAAIYRAMEAQRLRESKKSALFSEIESMHTEMTQRGYGAYDER